MASPACVELVGCETGQIVHVRGGLTSTPVNNFFNANLGLVVEVTEPANFNETYYTVSGLCYIYDPACSTCFSDILTIQLDPITGLPVNIQATGEDECFGPQVAYVLIVCGVNVVFDNPEDIDQNPDTALVTSTDLSLYVGSVINIAEHPGYCYRVVGPFVDNTGCPCDLYTVTQSFPDCECCLPDEPVRYTRVIPNPVKQFYHIPNTECNIRTNTTFANGYYKYFKSLAYGVETCCDNIDLDMLWIRKELEDYASIQIPIDCTIIEPLEQIVCEGPQPEE